MQCFAFGVNAAFQSWTRFKTSVKPGPWNTKNIDFSRALKSHRGHVMTGLITVDVNVTCISTVNNQTIKTSYPGQKTTSIHSLSLT